MPSSPADPLAEQRITIRLPGELYGRVQARASFDGASGIAEWVRDLLRVETCIHPKPYEGVCGACGKTGV